MATLVLATTPPHAPGRAAQASADSGPLEVEEASRRDAADGSVRRPTLSLRWILPCASVVLTSLVAGSVALVGERSARQSLTTELVQRLCTQATNVALVSQSAVLSSYPELTLCPILLKTREQMKELRFATVCDRHGRILGDADPKRVGQLFAAPPELGAPRSMANGVEVFESRTLILAAAPVRHPDGRQIATAFVGVPRSYVESSVRESRRPVLVLLAVLVTGGTVASFVWMSFLLRPVAGLQAGIERIGRGDLAVRLDESDRSEFGTLAASINRMARDLGRAQGEVLERERLSHEMSLAQHLQHSLLPKGPLVAPPFIVRGSQRQAQEVGGDFYDSFRLPDGRIGIAIADVTGKGLGGCLVTSMLAGLLGYLRETSSSPAQLLSALDHALSLRLERGTFVTCFVAFVDPRRGELTWASAGHHPALLVHADRTFEWLEKAGSPLGFDRKHGVGRTLVETRVALSPGDLLVQTTDGIHESERGPDGEQLGLERQAAIIVGAADRSAAGIIHELSNAATAWRGDREAGDDETIVAIHWDPDMARDAMKSHELLSEARTRGVRLVLPPTLEALGRLEPWLDRAANESGFPRAHRPLAALALYEVCANIVEHGKPADGSHVELWWLPSDGDPNSVEFLIQDFGTTVLEGTPSPVDYGDPGRRRRGRGFGLDLIARAGGHIERHQCEGSNVTHLTLTLNTPIEEVA